MDQEKPKTEQNTAEGTPPPEHVENELQLDITRSLRDEYIDGENLAKRGYVNDAVNLRNAFHEQRKTNASDTEAFLRLADESPLVQKRDELVNARLNKDQVQQIGALNDLLRQNPDLLTSLRNGLLAFQYDRLDAMKISPVAISQHMTHLRRVVSYIDQADNPPPLAILAAAVHDIEKIAKVGDADQHFLAEHEYMSAALGGEVVASALKAANLGQYAESAQIMIAKAILPHGEGEWPELQAEKGTLPMTSSLNDAAQEKFLLLGGLFLKSPRSAELGMVDDSVDQDDVRTGEIVREMRMAAKAVSAADKMDGLGDKSLIKYHIGNSLGTIYSRASSYDYAISFTETLVYNMRNAPDVLGIKHNPQVEGIVHRAALLISILDDVQTHPALSELDLAAGDPVPDFLPPYSDALGTDVAKGLVMTAIEMRSLFADVKKRWNTEAHHDAAAERESNATIVKAAYGEKLAKLVDDLMAIGDPYAKDPILQKKLDHTLASLQGMYP